MAAMKIILRTEIAGMRFRPANNTYTLQAHTPLELVPEPENPKDQHALKVCVDDLHLGYIPALASQVIARLIKLGFVVDAIATSPTRIAVRIRVEDTPNGE